MRRRERLLPVVLVFALLILFNGFGGPAQAQKKTSRDTTGLLPAEGADKLEKQYREKTSQFRALSRGERPATKADAELIDLGAKYHVYRLTWGWLLKDPNTSAYKPGAAAQLINQLELVLKEGLQKRKDTDEFRRMFTQQLHVRIKEVLNHNDMLVRINAALMLPLVARAGNPETASFLADVLSESQNEAVRYWAVQALRELFAQARLDSPLRVRLQEEPERRCIILLNEYVSRPPDFPDRIVRVQQALADPKKAATVTDDEKKELDQYESGFQLARRAGIRALAETRYPALNRRTEDGQQVPDEKGMTALALTRILADDVQSLVGTNAKKAKGIPPKASLSEKVEAAIGLCQLQSTLTPAYNPDYAIDHVGRFLVHFADLSNNQRNLNQRNLKKEPWRHHAGRLLVAINELQLDMKKRSATDAATKYVMALIPQVEPFVRSVEIGANADPSGFRSTPPPNKTLFRGLDKAVVRPAEPDMP